MTRVHIADLFSFSQVFPGGKGFETEASVAGCTERQDEETESAGFGRPNESCRSSVKGNLTL